MLRLLYIRLLEIESIKYSRDDYISYSYSQLVEIRLLNRATKRNLSNLYTMLISVGVAEDVFDEIELLKKSFDDAGILCDCVSDTVDDIIKKLDEKHAKKEIRRYEPTSRYEL